MYKSKAANPEITFSLSAPQKASIGSEFKVLLEINGRVTGQDFYISYDPNSIAYFKDWDSDPNKSGVTALDVGDNKAFFTALPIIENLSTENNKRILHIGLVSTSSTSSPPVHHITLTFKAIKTSDQTTIEIDTTKPYEFVGETEGGMPIQFDLASSSTLSQQIETTSTGPTETPTATLTATPTSTPTSTPTPPLEQFSEKSQDITSSSPSKNLYYPLVVRNWPSGNAGSSQWSHIILSNPNAETASATLTVWGATTYDTIQAGSKLKEYSISIPPHGTYSSYSDDNWKNLPDTYSQEGDQTIGALSISSNVAISGINRWQMRKGNTFDGTPEQVFDTPLIANPSFSLHSPLVVRNWASGKEGYTQWSDIMLFNPNTDAIDVAFTVFHATEEKNGLLLKRFTKTIPGHGWLNTYGMDEWKNLEENSPTAEIKAAVSITGPIDKPFVGISRWKLVQGRGVHSNPTVSTIDTPLLPQENKLFYPLALRNWPSGTAGLTQWTDLLLYNPNNEAVSVTIYAKENNPKSSGSSGPITIPPHGYYGTYGKDWLAFPRQANEPDQTNANVSINVAGIYGIVGISRWRLVAGDTATGTLQSLSDTPLMGESKANEVAFPLIARGIPTGMNGNNLWNDIAIFNPSDTPNKVLFKLYSSRDNNNFKNGSTLRVFEYIIPPYDYLNTYSLGQWHALPTNNADPVFSQSSLVVESENPVYAIERMRYLDTAPSNNCQKKPLGDADCNNEIEPTDYEEWGEEFGLTTKETIADFNNNGKINLDDFEIWRSNL
ncbi:MAG: hypothetical protein Q8P72_02570 [Candidatus Roizmanbacteria bacterium]|nr:hypothetical protein [Candidatus Roizmanbacteria bacterium]